MKCMLVLASVVFVHSISAGAVPIVFEASGTNAAAIQSTVDAFRTALGSPNNGDAAGPLAGGRREINWDGGGSTDTTPPATPFDTFRNIRGAQFTTPGTGLSQAPPSGGAANGLVGLFGNPTYGSIFTTFSDARLFVPVGSNITDASFFIPGSNGAVAAAVSGFGAVFSDVDLADVTSMEFFDPDGNSLGAFKAPTADNGLSFLGVRFTSELISRVRITTGNSALGPNDGGSVDVVAMDDFIYAEPQQRQRIPEPSTWLLLLTGTVGFLWRQRIRS